jgi:hypothetical protein
VNPQSASLYTDKENHQIGKITAKFFSLVGFG